MLPMKKKTKPHRRARLACICLVTCVSNAPPVPLPKRGPKINALLAPPVKLLNSKEVQRVPPVQLAVMPMLPVPPRVPCAKKDTVVFPMPPVRWTRPPRVSNVPLVNILNAIKTHKCVHHVQLVSRRM